MKNKSSSIVQMMPVPGHDVSFADFLSVLPSGTKSKYVIDMRYIAVIYNTIVYTAQKLQWQNFGQNLY